MSDALLGFGAEFHLDDASDVLTEIAEITSVTLPNSQVEDVEVTHMGSTGRRREYIAGLIEDGEGSFEMNLVPGSASDILLRAALADGATRDYKIVIPHPTTTWEVTGDCVVKGYERSVPMDGKMTATLTVRFTGAATEAASI